MKKRILVLMLLLCLGLFCGRAYAAQSGEEHLVSVSDISEVFLPRVHSALSEAARQQVSQWQSQNRQQLSSGLLLRVMAMGDSLWLGEGQQFMLLSGTARFAATGELVNTARGTASYAGVAEANARYIVCENAGAYLDAETNCLILASAGAVPAEGCPFQDVERGAWYYGDLMAAYRRGLINGVDPVTYLPYAALTGAEGVKLAACIHQSATAGAVTLTNSIGTLWYRSYVDYARNVGILSAELDNYDAPMTRAEFVHLFYRAMPESAYTQINPIPDGSIPDLPAGVAYRAEIYRFYRAGILTGLVDTEGIADYAFCPENPISRAEVATIMNRMFDETARRRFTIVNS